MLVINHCKIGRLEGEFPGGEMVYLGEGDMAVNLASKMVIKNSFPLGRFQGAMLLLEPDKAAGAVQDLSAAFAIAAPEIVIGFTSY